MQVRYFHEYSPCPRQCSTCSLVHGHCYQYFYLPAMSSMKHLVGSGVVQVSIGTGFSG